MFPVDGVAALLAAGCGDDSGETGLVPEDKRIAADLPVTAPDGSTADASVDFICPG